ncbi:MAG TPA: hypothetical protein VE326_12535 [Candidatus Binatia bacterium]|nr:hypothetical protein [Candidatus Binatia bacterium]
MVPWKLRQLAALPLVAALTLLAACGKDNPARPAPASGPSEPPVTTATVADSLQFTVGGSAIAMGTAPLVCCGLYDPSFVNERAMRVVFYDPANQKAGWQLLILIDRAQQGEVAVLPTPVVAPSKVPRISMFVPTLGNEYNSDTDGSSGTITVHSFHCSGSAIEVYFSIDATLHSEFWDGGSIEVQGAFRGTFPPQACE